MVRLLGIGDNTVDIYIDQGVQFPGGNAVNVAVLAKRVGAQTSYLGCLGKDVLGDLVFDSLQAEGVDVSRCRRIDGPNPWCRIGHKGNDRFFAGSIPGVRAQYGFDTSDEGYLQAHDVAHTSVPSQIDPFLPFLKRNLKMLSYDYSEFWRKPECEMTFPYVDIAFLSYPDGSDAECRDLAYRIAERGIGTVVVTRGAEGSCALSNNEFRMEGIRPVEVVDTLGAGDAFIAAFLVSHCSGDGLDVALAKGAENAAHVCTYKGAFGHGRATEPGQPGLLPVPGMKT